MKIKNHLLYGKDDKQVSFYPTPNKGGKYAGKLFMRLGFYLISRCAGEKHPVVENLFALNYIKSKGVG